VSGVSMRKVRVAYVGLKGTGNGRRTGHGLMQKRDQKIVRRWRNPRTGGVSKLPSGSFCTALSGDTDTDGEEEKPGSGQVDVLSLWSLCCRVPAAGRGYEPGWQGI